MKSSSVAGRRALASLAALALSGGAIAVGAGPASAAPPDPDVTGAVVNAANVGLAGVDVIAYTTPANGAEPKYVGASLSDATGHYSLNFLDPASLALASSDPAVTSETEFKLFFSWSPSTPAEYHSRWSGTRPGSRGTTRRRA